MSTSRLAARFTTFIRLSIRLASKRISTGVSIDSLTSMASTTSMAFTMLRTRLSVSIVSVASLLLIHPQMVRQQHAAEVRLGVNIDGAPRPVEGHIDGE